MKLRWGIVSTAGIADTAVLPALKRRNGEVSCVVSREAARAEAFAARHGIPVATTSYEALLARDDVDAVYIGTPNALHAEQVRAAAAAGKHVLCEKPLATTVEDARAAIEACRAAGVRLGVNFQARHNDAVIAARDLVARGAIGEVVLVECEVAYPGGAPAGWRADRGLAGLGTAHNLGVHAFDLIRHLTGSEFTEVAALFDAEPP
jgi:1,5-anhydro-D-fructose reductase (1,5-anhydro-D-mannitol-forming)